MLRIVRLAGSLLFAIPMLCTAGAIKESSDYQRVMKDRAEVLEIFRTTPRIKEVDRGNVLQFVDRQQATIFLVTKEGHPAHPAMVTQRMVEESGRLVVNLNYDGGGDQAALAQWIREIDESAREITREAGRAPLAEAPSSTIGYKSVREALTALKARHGTLVHEQEGWTIIEDKEDGNTVLWSFVPAKHPAYPAVVKRMALELDGGVHIAMKVLCQASKSSCDQLVRDFQALSEQEKTGATTP